MSVSCNHPKGSRTLMPGGYDVSCGECEQLVGRVAIFPDAVLGSGEASELLRLLPVGAEGRGVRSKLSRAARRSE